MVRTGPVSAASNIAWRGDALIATTTVMVEDLALYADGASAAPWLRIGSLRSTAVASSDGRASSGALDASDIRVAIPVLPASLPCSAGTPCEARLGRDGFHVENATVPEQVRDAVETVLSAVRVAVPEQPLDAGGIASAGVGATADGPGVAVSADRRSVAVGGLVIDLATTNSAEGRTVVRLTVGGAAAAASTAASEPFIDVEVPVDAGHGGRPALGSGFSAIVPGIRAPVAPGAIRTQPVLHGAAHSLPASMPIPAGIMLLAVAVTLSGAAALVAFGVWGSIP
jgi:hypothetical protein